MQLSALVGEYRNIRVFMFLFKCQAHVCRLEWYWVPILSRVSLVNIVT